MSNFTRVVSFAIALSFALSLPLLHAMADGDSPQTIFVPQVAELTASGQTEFFGLSVAIDSDTAVVGTPSGGQTYQGAAYVFTRPKDGWKNMTPVAVLTASDAKESDGFGCSVAVSADTIVVGAPGADYDSCNQAPGAVYVFVKPATGWVSMTETAKLRVPDIGSSIYSSFGSSVAISGDVVVAGAPGSYASRFSGEGAAYVFVKPADGWSSISPTATLTPSDPIPQDDLFGWSVAMSGNTVVVGAGGKSAAYVFIEPPGGWVNMTETAKLTTGTGDQIGFSVAVVGNTVVSGSESSNSVYVFVRPNDGWRNMAETARLTADGSEFGWSVALSRDLIVGGAPQTTRGPNASEGAVFVFLKPKDGWKSTGNYNTMLTGSDAKRYGQLGISVAVSGGTILTGADRVHVGYAGAAYMFGNP